MNNKVTVSNQKYQLLKTVIIILLAFIVLAIMVLFTFRALDTRNYNGNVTEVSGTVISIDQKDDDVEITLSDNVVYNANRINTCYPNFDLNSLKDKHVTFYLPEQQTGARAKPWIIGIKQDEQTLIDYREVIADGKAEAKQAMIISGALIGVFAVASIALFWWRMRIGPSKEQSLFETYAEFAKRRQPSCPEYRYLGIAAMCYVVATMIVGIVISSVCSTVENLAVQISVAVVMCVVFVGCTVGLLLTSKWLVKKERKYYAENYPFDLDDISHVRFYGKQNKRKQQIQDELREERKKFPHRYYDAGNNYTVEFTQNGVEFFDEEESFSSPNADYVFGEGEETTVTHTVYKLTYQQLNFEALPYYSRKDHPLAVIIKSRIEDTSTLPEEMVNDFHLLLDSNLLTTLRNFDVPVENLQDVLEHKAQLIEDNCVGKKK